MMQQQRQQQQSNTKKRRLAALEQQHASGNFQGGLSPKQQQQRHGNPHTGSTADKAYQLFSFPSGILDSQVGSKLMLPAASTCHGNIEEALEALMRPHMPPAKARSDIAARIAPDKPVVLASHTGKLNLTRPNSTSKMLQQKLTEKLLPRAKRMQLTALPKAGIDYNAMLLLHNHWCDYVSGLLANTSRDQLERLLQALDWHGALFRVVSSSNPIYVQRAGIVAKATMNTFVLVSEDGRSSIVPINRSRFQCSIQFDGTTVTFELSGSSFHALNCVVLPSDQG